MTSDSYASSCRNSPDSRLYYFPFPARHSGEARYQRRALASTALADTRLLKIRFRMAQHLRLAREWCCFSGRRKSAGRVVLLRHDCGGLLCPY